MPDTKALIESLLANKSLREETVDELTEIREAARQGPLDPSDIDYVNALAKRLGIAEGDAPKPANDAANADGADAAADAAERAEIAERRLGAAEAEIASLTSRIESIRGEIGTARRALVELYSESEGINMELSPDEAARRLDIISDALDATETKLGKD